MDKKLVCHINTTFNSRSGSAKRTRKILNACLKNGYEVLLITGDSNDINPETLEGITLEIIPELIKPISPKKDFQAYKKMQALLSHYQPCVVHTHLAKAGILGRLSARNISSNIIHTVHGPTFPKSVNNIKRLVFWTLEFYVARYTDTFIFVGEELKQTFINARIANISNSRVINTARDDDQINYQSLSKKTRAALKAEITSNQSTDTKIISYVARLVPGKQQDHAIQVLRKIHLNGFKNTHLVLVGKALVASEVQFEKELRSLAKTLELEPFVHFLGHRNDVLEIMDASDVVILPSKYEGLPNVVVEAVLSGTPVVSYDVSGVEEVLGKLCEELVVKQGDIDGMTNAIISIFNKPDNLLKKYKKLKEKIRNRFSNKVMLESKMKLYEKAINGESDAE